MNKHVTQIKPLRQRISRVLGKGPLIFALAGLTLSHSISAQEQDWWFDIEVILFERNLDSAGILEEFQQSALIGTPTTAVDLLSPYISTDVSYLRAGLDFCQPSRRLAAQQQYQQDFAFPAPAPAPTPDINTSQSVDNLILAEDDFQYEVATDDIFNDSRSPSRDQASDRSQQSLLASTAVLAKTTRHKPAAPIAVTFIEWQMPRHLPCAYSEQIEPSITALNHLKSQGLTQKISRVPVEIDGIEWASKAGAFLLPRSALLLADLYQKIKQQRNVTPLLHTAWRQEVAFGQDNAQSFRLFAGKNFSEEFDSLGAELSLEQTQSSANRLLQDVGTQGYLAQPHYMPEQERALLAMSAQSDLAQQAFTARDQLQQKNANLFSLIDAALVDETPLPTEVATLAVKIEPVATEVSGQKLAEIWQIDGEMTVYLRNVGRVPYLHINSKFDYRQPMLRTVSAQPIQLASGQLSPQNAQMMAPVKPPQRLQSVNFNQLRRVVSQQVHYFDHPLFGLIVRINRYQWPIDKIPPELNN
jgi:hypothetical protein